ncbi:hypothetical protein NC653_014969 [Populus alba x Populus x berolinensis]|uniref:Uncharacterized protein n=1 Tax=Populus alba x Populus x berolinensis TaxID=444605 RepID=A0AAD6QZG4_9ROSI|nr:hypothetical protein NC653_014969 [Populus alba x Populus x berolinensis]
MWMQWLRMWRANDVLHLISELQAREMGNKSKKNYLARRDVFNWTEQRTKSNGANTTKEKADQWVGSGSPYLLDGFNLPNEVTLNLEDSNEMNDGTVKLATPVEANSQADSQGCSHSATSLKGKKRKASSVDAVERELKGIKDAIKEVARAIREGNLIAERGRPRVYSEQEVFPELVRIGVETHLRYKASTFLVANSGRVRAFFGCPPWERRDR